MQNCPPLKGRNTKVCVWGEVPDLIIPIKFNVDWFRFFQSMGSKNRGISLTRQVALTTVLHYHADYDVRTSLIIYLNAVIVNVGTSLLIHTATEQSSASYYGEQGLHYVDVKGESCLVPRGMFSFLNFLAFFSALEPSCFSHTHTDICHLGM